MIAKNYKCDRCGLRVIKVRENKKARDGELALCAECYYDDNNPDETCDLRLRGEQELRMMEVRKNWAVDIRKAYGEGIHTPCGDVVSIDGGVFRHGRLPPDDDEPMQRVGLCVVNPE